MFHSAVTVLALVALVHEVPRVNARGGHGGGGFGHGGHVHALGGFGGYGGFGGFGNRGIHLPQTGPHFGVNVNGVEPGAPIAVNVPYREMHKMTEDYSGISDGPDLEFPPEEDSSPPPPTDPWSNLFSGKRRRRRRLAAADASGSEPCPCTVSCRGDEEGAQNTNTTWQIGEVKCSGLGWGNGTGLFDAPCDADWIVRTNTGEHCDGKHADNLLFAGGCEVTCGAEQDLADSQAPAAEASECTCTVDALASEPPDYEATAWACNCASPSVLSARCEGAGCNLGHFVVDIASKCAQAAAAAAPEMSPNNATAALESACEDVANDPSALDLCKRLARTHAFGARVSCA